MMTKRKRLLMIIIFILLLLIVLGGCLAFVYVKTDLLKTDEELFYKYFKQNQKLGNLIDQEWIKNYHEQIKKNPYQNRGEITFSCDNGQEQEIINATKLAFSGVTDKTNGKQSQNIKVINHNNQYFELKFLKTKDSYGLKSDEVVNKYITIENKNLQELITNLGIGQSQIKIEKIQGLNYGQIKQINDKAVQRYKTVLKKYLTKKQFESQKNVAFEVAQEQVTGNIYHVKLTQAQLYQLLIELLETLQKDSEGLTIICSFFQEQITQEELSEIFNQWLINLKKKDALDEEAFRISLYEKDGILQKTQLEIFDKKIIIQYRETQESFYSKIKVVELKNDKQHEIEIEKVKNAMQYNIVWHEYKEEKEVAKTVAKIIISMEDSIKNTISIGRNDGTKIVQINYKNEKNFVDDPKIEELKEENSVWLNAYEKEELQTLLQAIQNRLEQLYIQRISQLGLSNNPFFNPDSVISKEREFFNRIQNSQARNNLNQEEIQVFNSKFENYKTLGDEEKRTEGIIKTIYDHNQTYKEENKKVKLQINNQDFGYLEIENIEQWIQEVIKQNNSYTISYSYNEETKRIEKVILTN